MAQVPERGVRDVRDSWGVEALFGGFDKPEQVHSRLVIPPKVAQSNYGYGGGPNGGINPLELSWDEQRFLAQLASDRKMVSDRARAHELSARASTGVRAGGVPSFVDVASPAKPVVARGVRTAASAEFARPSSAATWHERERAGVRARGATSSTASPSSSRPRPATASNRRSGGPVPSASPVRPALKHRSNTSSPYKSPAKRSVQWEPGVTDAGIVTDHPSVGGQSPVPMSTKKSYLHTENNELELELEAVPTSRRNLKFGGPGGGGGAPGGPRASWPGPKNGGVETLSNVKHRIHGSNHSRPDVDETRLSKDERQFLDAMGSHRVMVSDRARLAASVAELGLLPTGDAPITTQPGAGYKTRPGGVARPNTGSPAGGPKQVSAVDYANSGAPIAPVRASWNPDASPSREEAAFDPAKSLRQSLTRPRTSPATGALHRDENDDPTDYPYDPAPSAGTHDPNPWADRNASLRAAVRNRLRPSSARSQVSSLGDLNKLEQTVEALRKSYRRADPPARGRGASARLVTMSVDAGIGGLSAERAVKIAEREARDWEWQSSWQWEWQQELDVETRGRRRPATAAPTTTRRQQQQPQQQVLAKVNSSPVKSPVKSPVTASAMSTPTKTNFTPGLTMSSAVNTPVMKSPAPSARKPPRSPAFVKSPAALTRSPFREPIVAAKPVSPAPASPVRREREPTPKVVEASSVVEEDPEPSVKFGRRARASGMHASPAAAMPSPTLPSPPTLKETSPSPSPEKGTYAERREAYRGSKGAAAAETPSPSLRRSPSPAFVRRLSDASIGEDIETLPDELSSAGDDSDIEVVELMEVGAGFGSEEAIWKPASSKYV